MPTRIVILGGGFGGIYTLLSLRKHMKKIPYKVTLISDKDYFSFTPFLSEVAANILPSDDAESNIKDFIKGDKEEYVKGKAERIDLENKKVYLNDNIEYPFDYLVIAIGSTTNFLHVNGAEAHSLVLKDISDAVKIKGKIDEIFSEAVKEDDLEKRKQLLTFAVIGGGPTGIEIAGDIEEHIHHLIHEVHESIQESDVNLMLINGGSEIAKEFDEDIRQKASEMIREEHIMLKLNARVKEIQDETIILTDDSTIKAHTIIWAAGVKANSLTVIPSSVIDQTSQKFIVDPFLRLNSFLHTFAIGDIAMFANNPRGLPMLAQAALAEGLRTGENISYLVRGKTPKPFEFHSQGELVSIGKGEGIASIHGINLSGGIAWLLWRFVYLYKYIDTRKKPSILLHWLKDSFN